MSFVRTVKHKKQKKLVCPSVEICSFLRVDFRINILKLAGVNDLLTETTFIKSSTIAQKAMLLPLGGGVFRLPPYPPNARLGIQLRTVPRVTDLLSMMSMDIETFVNRRTSSHQARLRFDLSSHLASNPRFCTGMLIFQHPVLLS